MNRVYNHATIIEKANIYFEGKVTSRTVIKESGEKITLGFMQPGEYQFNTSERECMEVINGEMVIRQAGETDWLTYTSGMAFTVPKNSSFDVQVKTFADYCCSYLESE